MAALAIVETGMVEDGLGPGFRAMTAGTLTFIMVFWGISGMTREAICQTCMIIFHFLPAIDHMTGGAFAIIVISWWQVAGYALGRRAGIFTRVMTIGADDFFMTPYERVKTVIEVIADKKHVFKADSF